MNILTLLDIVASVDPARVAVGDQRDGLTLAQLRELAGRAAAVMQAEPGRPFLFGAPTGPAFPVALFGAALAGRSFVPVSYRLAPGPLHSLLEAQSPATLVAEPRTTADLTLPDGIAPLDTAGFLDDVRAAQPLDADADQDPEHAAVLLHTSGTTGQPKVAVLRHRHLTSYVLNGTEMLGADADEAALVCVPPYHIAGVAGLLTGIYCGRRIVYLPDFDAARWVELARSERITHAMVVPTMLARIVEHLEATGERLPDLRHLSYGGGRMPRSVISRALRLMPHVDFVNAYGLTETSSSIAVLGPAEHREAQVSSDPTMQRRLESVGRPLPSVEIVVHDALGQPVPVGERGELWVRGPQVSGEYGGTSTLDQDGWFRTKDSGWIDSDGYVYVEGRLDDVIVRGGENLSPGEIEDVIAAHPEVVEVAVFGVHDEQWGEVPVAAVVTAAGSGLDEPAVQQFVADRLRSTRVPAHVVFLSELPRNDMGKVLRRSLKADRSWAGSLPVGTAS